MDKTFNDLMDIVNRTKKLDGSDRPRPRPTPRPRVEEDEEEYSPREYDIVEEKPKRTRTTKKDSPDLFAGSAVEKLVKKTTKPTTKKATTTKKSTTTKKTTTKSTTKSTPKTETPKKPSTPKVSKPKLTKDDVLSEIKVKLDKPKTQAKATTTPNMNASNASDPKNAQLYEALKNSLFSGGTDISEYMEMQENNDARASLQELKAKREAHKINEEITKEQQEYEQLFNGSFESQYENSQLENFEEDEGGDEENVNVAEKNARLANELNAIRSNLAQKKNNPTPISQVNTVSTNKKDETYELETGNRDLDRKIAEYYKRKQEKINEYNAREEEGVVEEPKAQEDGPVDYEAIFGGSMMTRDELLGIEREPEENELIEEELTEEDELAEENVESENGVSEEITEDGMTEEKEETTEESVESPFATLARSFEDANEEPTEVDEEKIVSALNENVEEKTETIEENLPENSETTIDEIPEDTEDGETNVEETNENSEEEHKEDHIKSLLSDLLFSKKIYSKETASENATEDNASLVEEDNTEDKAIEDETLTSVDTQGTQEESTTNAQVDYEKIWNETFMSGIGNSQTVDTTADMQISSQDTSDVEDDEESQENENLQDEKQETAQDNIEQVEDTQEEMSEEELLDSLSLNIGKVSEENSLENTTTEDATAEDAASDNASENDEAEDDFASIENVEDGANEPEEDVYDDKVSYNADSLLDEESNVVENGNTTESQTYQPILESETEEETSESVVADIIDGQEGFLTEESERSQSETLESDEISDDTAVDETPSAENMEEVENTYSDGGYDEHFESVVNNERIYENTQKNNYSLVDEDSEDNTCVVETLPENRYDLFGNSIVSEEEKEDEVYEDKKDDTISKEEFYNEMARLQENLINQLKGNATTESRDFFAEKDPEEEKRLEEKVDKLVDDIVKEYDQDVMEESESIVDEQKTEEVSENVVEESEEPVCKAEPVDPEHYDDYNLLGKEEPLNDEDLEFQEKSEEEKTPEKDAYFYLSPEDNEKKAQEVDEYVQLFNEDSVQKEVGDIHIFKTIGNASPSSEILKNLDDDSKVKTEENENANDEEVEAIYTLMGIERKPIAKAQPDMKVLYVASECQPFVASGGLGDVTGSLPKAIASKGGVDIRVILPLYSSIKSQYRDKFEYLGNFTVHLSWRQEYCGLFRYYKDGVTYYFVDNERYFKRDKLYGYYDDGERFAYFSKAVVEALPYLNFFPDIIHCNDWQSSLVSAYIKTGNWSDFRYYKIKNIYTIHNVEYQGVYGMENLKDLFGIDSRFRNDMEYNGDINLTKSAIQFSDKFTTVSKSYCDNLKQPYCSRGLHHIIIRNEYKLSGIVNGIDYDFYNPATDTSLFKNYDFGCIEDKVLNKKLWQDEMGLPVDGNTPMIAIVSRLVNHKGIDLVMKVIEEVLDNDIQLVVVGTGDEKYVSYFKYLEGKYPTKVRALVDEYSNENARKAYASSDIFLMPSKIEPCGISQMIASRYGCVPIVREVGGLKDTIRDFGCEGGGNGYTFTNYNPNDLKYQLNRAIRDYENKSGWREKMKICMSVDFTWDRPAEEYIKLYKSLYETM